jgi:hypothetical protein
VPRCPEIVCISPKCVPCRALSYPSVPLR